MRPMHLKYLITFLFLTFSILPVYAGDGHDHGELHEIKEQQHQVDWENTGENVLVFIHSEKTTIQPNDTVTLLLEKAIRPEWHTYWKNPGDSGEPLKANWSLPEGFEISEISWPTPHGVPFDPLLNYGYEGPTFLIQTLKVPETLPKGQIDISVRFDILVCKDICIPESVERTLHFNVTEPSKTPKKASALLIIEARSLLPTPQQTHKWIGKLSEENEQIVLKVTTNMNPDSLNLYNFEFFPYEYGLVKYAAKPEISFNKNQIIFKQERGAFSFDRIDNLGGIFVLNTKDGEERFAYEILPEVTQTTSNASTEKKTKDLSTESEDILNDVVLANAPASIFHALLFAVIGGLILNLMPCVFPVLSMKVLSLAKISEKSKNEARKHGIAYTAGIILSFLAIAGLLIVLKAGGSEIGWGFHLQNPVVILLLAYLFFLIGLNLAGYFEIGGKLMSIGQGKKTEGVSGSFMTGILATIVATPCTAPFMAAALGYALVQPTYISLLIFAALGLGLALPYLLISFVPPLQKIMPRPGQWMVTFKEFLAFPMFATVIWLLWILSQQIDMLGFVIPSLGLLGITFAIWLNKLRQSASGANNIILLILSLLAFGGSIFLAVYSLQKMDMVKEHILPQNGGAYSKAALETALSSNQPVFVEMTAAWCVTCKVNNYRAINIPETKQIIEDRNIIYLIGDWTNYDADITEYLNKFGRNGVPIYIYYGRPDNETGQRPEPVMLPQILTPGNVADVLDQ